MRRPAVLSPAAVSYVAPKYETFSAGRQVQAWTRSTPAVPNADCWQLPPRYRLKQLLGSGSYGSVRAAYDQELGRPVAIKRLGRMFDDLVDCKRTLREVLILSRLEHDNIVKLYDIPVPPDPQRFNELYIVMELCDSDLRKLCRTSDILTPLHAYTLMYGLLLGLRYIHSAGIYHRDLKPANCLVNEDCSVKICDFGLARAIWDGEHQGPSVPPSLAGGAGRPMRQLAPRRARLTHLAGHVTPWYCAPELMLLQDHYTEVIDIWSAGCIFAELLGASGGAPAEERGPLFPGLSSSTLTLGVGNGAGEHDQLSVIFNVIGTPSECDIESLDRPASREHVRRFAKRPGEGFQRRFPFADGNALDLLERMLRFRAEERITVPQALEHVLFAGIREPPREVEAGARIRLDVEREPRLDGALLRRYFCEQIGQYHREFLGRHRVA